MYSTIFLLGSISIIRPESRNTPVNFPISFSLQKFYTLSHMH